MKTPIKFFEKLNDDLKKHICLIDLPGGDTANNRFNESPNKKKSKNLKNKNEDDKRTLYEKLLYMSTSFIFINRGRALRDEKNIDTIKKSFNKIPSSNKFDLLKSCLFVINMFGDLKDDERDKNKLKSEIVTNLFNNENQDLKENTNVTFFDAKAYKEYLREEKFFTNINYYLENLYINFKKQNDNIFNNMLNVFNKNDNFINFCLNEIKTKVESLTFENEKGEKIKFDKKKKCDVKIYEIIEKYILGVMQKLGKKVNKSDVKKIEEFANIYEQVNKNLTLMNLFKKSNNIDFFNSLINIMNNSNKKAEIEYKKQLKDTIDQFNNFFSIDILNKNNDKEEESMQIRDEFLKKFNNEVENGKNNINKIFDDMEKDLKNYLKIQKSDSEVNELLKKNNYDLEKSFKVIYNEMENIIKKYTNLLEQEVKNINDQIENIRLQYIEKITSLTKSDNSTDNINNNISLNSNNIKFSSTLQNASVAFMTLGIGELGILAAIFEVSMIPGVGLLIGGALALIGLTGYIFSDSNKTKFIKAIDKTYNDLEDNLNTKKRLFNQKFDDFYKKLKDDYENKTSLQISNLEGVKIEKFNESKEKFFKAKKLLLDENQINENEEESNENKEE